MLTYTIKKDSVYTWFYKWITGKDELPEGMCNFFWMVVLSWVMMILTTPLFLILICFKDFRKDPTNAHPAALLVFEILLVILGMFISGIVKMFMMTWEEFLHMAIGICILIGTIAVFSLVVIGIGKFTKWVKDSIFDWRYSRMTEEEKIAHWEKDKQKAINAKQKSFIRTGWDAFIEKNCPKINWK